MSEFKITERGWAGHFICSNRCNFRRNTLIEYGDKKVVVSTVGLMEARYSTYAKRIYETVGAGRYYETMCFWAKNDKYKDADVGRQIFIDCNWAIDKLSAELEANEMHDNYVNEVKKYILNNEN